MNIPGVTGRIGGQDPSVAQEILGAALAQVSGDNEVPACLVDGPVSAAVIDGDCRMFEDVLSAISGNVDWLNVELADVQMKRGPSAALYQAYRQHGEQLLDVIGGRFALFLWDKKRQMAWLACDRFGQMPVYWARGPEQTLLFGQTASAVAGMLPRRPEISLQGVYNYLYFHMVPGPGTIFEGIQKLMAGHMLRWQGGQWEIRRYWTPTFDEHDQKGLAEAGEEMLGLLSSSVARLAEGKDTGAFLSGGLDSSTVAGLLARHRPKPRTYSIGFDAEGYDEIGFARIAADHFDTDFRAYYVTPDDVLSALPRIAAAYDEPFGNSSALPAYFCARFAAEDGRQRLLAGDGGDELFAGNERYAKQEVFERYASLPGLTRQYLLEPLIFRSWADRLPKIGKARSYIRQAKVPLPDRLQTYNFINRLGADKILAPALRSAVDMDQPLELDRAIYHAPVQASRLNRMLYLDWHHTLADNDLRKVNRMCQLAGIEVEYPMLDDRLVDFSTRVSSRRKMPGRRLRDFYKRAVTGLLPQAIIHKSKHGFGLPFGVWMAEHPGLQELAGDNLERMRRRQLINEAFIEELNHLHGNAHSGYYGEFIWVLMMLELWLTSQGIEP